MKTDRLPNFLRDLPPPMGLPPPGPETRKQNHRLSMVGHRKTPQSQDEWAYRLAPRQRFTIEFVRAMRVKVNESMDLFYLDVVRGVFASARAERARRC